MNIKGVLRNLKRKGIVGTAKIFFARNAERKRAQEVNKLLRQIKTSSQGEMSKDECLRQIKSYLQETMSKYEDSIGYGRMLKRICIKVLIPAVYETYKKDPIENKALFMQPRSGLNQSFKYIYRKIEREHLYDVELCELHRGEVTNFEYYCNAIEFAIKMATAKVVFVHESNNLMGYLHIRPETKVIQLWHGCGILKKIGLSTIGKKNFKSRSAYQEFPEYNNYSCVTIASPELSWVYEEFMGIDKESGIIQPIGVSRTDEFFDQGYIDKCYRKLYKIIPQAKNKKVILYAPTYRGLDPNRLAPDKLDVKLFAEKLQDEYILIIKHHQTAKEIPEIPEEYRDKFAFDMTRGKGMDINELMTVADICISDYSSLVFEYSLFERPLIFFVYDLEEYIDSRGLYYDFDEITPGPLCRTNEEMVDYIEHIDERFDKQEVIDFKNKFMCSCDGHSTERILELIK